MKFDFAKILEVSKRYWVIIVFCVVMILATVAIPAFVSGQQTALQKQLEDRKKINDDITQVLQKQRHQPVVALAADAAAPPLEQFPNERVIAAGENAIKGVQAQSLELKDDSEKINVHTLLVPPSTDTYQFRNIYLKQFETEIPKALDSATPPTQQEIDLRESQETQRLTDKQPKDAQGKVWNQTVLDEAIKNMTATMPEKMRLDAANQHKMYMAPSALSIHPALAPAQSAATVVPDAESIWLAQMGLWIQQDVVSAIAHLNANSTRVDTSPVKQLIELYVPTDRSLYILPVAAPGATAAPGAAAASPVAASTDTEPFPKDYSVSPTGRVSNGVFDVVQFDVVMNVQAADVERVIQEMERNRLLTVCQSEIGAVNSAALREQGYYFGVNPIVTLTLKCEELFMREWTHTLMPDPIKRFLNVDQQGTAADAGAAPAAPPPAPPAIGRPR